MTNFQIYISVPLTHPMKLTASDKVIPDTVLK